MQTPRTPGVSRCRTINIRHAPTISPWSDRWHGILAAAVWSTRLETTGDDMLTLSVIGVEDGAIVATSPSGERYRIPVDDALRSRLLESPTGPSERRLSPKEIQAHVRAGLTAQQVSALTGAPVAFVERFVGPVLAERAYVVESALAVRLPPETEGAKPRTFGSVMAERLAALNASGVKWTSAKEPTGWVLDVTFTADEIQHDARWRFDPKRMQLVAENTEAATLSQQGTPAALTPRLRAIEPTVPVTVIPQQPDAERATSVPTEPDRSRFDSAIFAFPDLAGQRAEQQEQPAARRGPTTDQLASLARRRGQREPSVDTASLPVTRSMQVIDGEDDDPFVRRSPAERETSAPVTRGRFPERLPETPAAEEEPALRRPRNRSERAAEVVEAADEPSTATSPVPVQPAPTRPRRGRTTMPSWDEIVFGRDDN
ncbi:MAG: hypothetical protein QOE37_446 [Microbacteriaceae bacterium]|nr:hypothetical protein [Microbacteriaceae bacterium]